MKTKPIFTALVMAALSLSSCSSNDPAELVAPVQEEVTQTVTFTASLPSTVASRSRSIPSASYTGFADGRKANNLYYAVYLDKNLIYTNVPYSTEDGTKYKKDDVEFSLNTNNKIEAKVSFNLVLGKEYDVVFWAQQAAYGTDASKYADKLPYKFDPSAQTVTIQKDYLVCNDDNLDAFYYHTAFTPTKETAAPNYDLVLQRPFAQLNIGTTDAETAEAAGVTVAQTTVTVHNAPTTFNVLTGKITDAREDLTYSLKATPKSQETASYPVGNFPYTYKDDKETNTFPDYLAMAYILVDLATATEDYIDTEISTVNSAALDIDFDYKDGGDKTLGNNIKKFYNVPLNRNHRTNIYGNILTTQSEWTIYLDPEFIEHLFNINVTENSSITTDEEYAYSNE